MFMAQSQCIRIPLVAEHAEAFVAWLSSLSNRRDELKEILAGEGMFAELAFVERRNGETALILYTRARDLAEANAAFERSQHPIDLEMKKWQVSAFDLAHTTTLDIVLELGQPDALAP